jgi:hypothetical protein
LFTSSNSRDPTTEETQRQREREREREIHTGGKNKNSSSKALVLRGPGCVSVEVRVLCSTELLSCQQSSGTWVSFFFGFQWSHERGSLGCLLMSLDHQLELCRSMVRILLLWWVVKGKKTRRQKKKSNNDRTWKKERAQDKQQQQQQCTYNENIAVIEYDAKLQMQQ